MTRKDVFDDLYRGLSREEVARQGRGHLAGRADVRAKRSVRWLWRLALLCLVGLIVTVAAFCAWALHVAQISGQSLHDVRAQAMRAYGDDP